MQEQVGRALAGAAAAVRGHQHAEPERGSLRFVNQQAQYPHANTHSCPPPPPSRPWLARRQSKQRTPANAASSRQLNHNKAYEFSALSYNVLADRMVYQDRYPSSPPLALDWLYRRQLILNQLLDYEPDIIALQELELEHYETYFKPELARLAAYESIFEPKSRAKTMDQQSRRRVDGCAIFYKFNKFKLIQRHLLEFNQIAMANAHGSEAMLNRVMTKDNIGLVAVLELTGKGAKVSSRAPNRLIVCNTHIHWNPECCDVKLIQTIMLMNELECIAKYYSPSKLDEATHQKAFLVDSATLSSFANRNHLTTSNSSSPDFSPLKDSHDLPPLVLLGDFNSMPKSGVTRYLTSGKIDSRHKDFKNFRYTSCTNALALQTQYYRNELTSARRQSTPAWCFYGQPNLSPSMSPTSSSSSNSSSSSTSSYMSALDSIPVQTDEPPVLNYNHPFHLQSAYEHNIMPYTNYTTDFKAIIDYIFFSSDSLQLLGLLGPLDKGWIKGNKITGLPHIHLPSDHLPLLIKLRFKPTPLRESSSHQLSAFTPSKNSSFRSRTCIKLDNHHYPNHHHIKQNNQTNKKNSNNNNITGQTIWHLSEPQNKHNQYSRS